MTSLLKLSKLTNDGGEDELPTALVAYSLARTNTVVNVEDVLPWSTYYVLFFFTHLFYNNVNMNAKHSNRTFTFWTS